MNSGYDVTGGGAPSDHPAITKTHAWVLNLRLFGHLQRVIHLAAQERTMRADGNLGREPTQSGCLPTSVVRRKAGLRVDW